jgi:hypothetical protein
MAPGRQRSVFSVGGMEKERGCVKVTGKGFLFHDWLARVLQVRWWCIVSGLVFEPASGPAPNRPRLQPRAYTHFPVGFVAKA